MLTGPVAAARAAAATGAWVKSKHGTYLIRESVGALSFTFTHPQEDFKTSKQTNPRKAERRRPESPTLSISFLSVLGLHAATQITASRGVAQGAV